MQRSRGQNLTTFFVLFSLFYQCLLPIVVGWSTSSNMRSSLHRLSSLRSVRSLPLATPSTAALPMTFRALSIRRFSLSADSEAVRARLLDRSDSKHNITDSIIAKVGRNLHLKQHHPLNMIKKR